MILCLGTEGTSESALRRIWSNWHPEHNGGCISICNGPSCERFLDYDLKLCVFNHIIAYQWKFSWRLLFLFWNYQFQDIISTYHKNQRYQRHLIIISICTTLYVHKFLNIWHVHEITILFHIFLLTSVKINKGWALQIYLILYYCSQIYILRKVSAYIYD